MTYEKASTLPVLGVGLGWRRDIAKEIRTHREHIDWCELIAEHYINVTPDKMQELEPLRSNFPLIPHGIDLSIGTDMPVEPEYLEGLACLVEKVDAPWFTDHLCFTRVPGYSIGQLTSLTYTEEVVEVVVRKTRDVQARIGRPFLLENIAYQFKVPGAEMSEAAFITRVAEGADIGLLLDVCNLYLNSLNHDYDPYEFLAHIPMDRVIQLHLAGGVRMGDKWIDSHSQPVHEEVFALTEHIVARAPVKGILIERDDNFPSSFDEIVNDLERARAILRGSSAAAVTSVPVRQGEIACP